MRPPPDQRRHRLLRSTRLSAEERRARRADWLQCIRLRMAIGRELDERGITTPAAIAEALGMPACEASQLLTRHRWHDGDVALREAAASPQEISRTVLEAVSMIPAEPAIIRWKLRAQVRELAAAVRQAETASSAFLEEDAATIRRYAAGDDVPLEELVAAIEHVRLTVSAICCVLEKRLDRSPNE